MTDSKLDIRRIQGPILVLGASGFVGANLMKWLLAERSDVVGTSSHLPTWRLEDIPSLHLRAVDLLVDSNIDALLEDVKPQTVFNCVAYGAYSFETQAELIYETNFNLTAKLLQRLGKLKIAAYIHAGSSSEYGEDAAGPVETILPLPNSEYSVSKVASANLMLYHGKKKGMPCANLRLYSVYGPLEDSSRLIPTVIRRGLDGQHSEYVSPDISRDFVYIDDVCDAFVKTAVELKPEDYGRSFNIGTGVQTTIGDVAELAGELFELHDAPQFSMPARKWDVSAWFANPTYANEKLGWTATTDFREGMALTTEWLKSIENKERYFQSSKKFGLDTKHSVTAIIACYKDAQAIPIMHKRLKDTFEKLRVEYEIIFVNDNSPDDSEDLIRQISRKDRRVVGISHSRNFGSQSAFRSGMEIATKNACVLLDGDLQDPPELIEKFVEKWREGYDVVYGRRIKRQAPFLMRWAYKAFYVVFDSFSYLTIPRDAGDFSLLNRNVVEAMLRFPERDLFLRGIRAFVGFKQTGIDYVRPERMFGTTTNNLSRNLGWAKKGILSFSNTPLTVLSYFGTVMLLLSTLLAIVQIIYRLMYPKLTPQGITTQLLVMLFFGSINLFAIGLVGEYIAKIFEEVKQRPHFIRRSIIKNGESRTDADTEFRK